MNTYNFTFALLAVLLAAILPKIIAEEDLILPICIAESGADATLVKKYENIKGNVDSNDKDIDGKVLCYYKCVFEKTGVLKQDGSIDPKTAEEFGMIEDHSNVDKKIVIDCLNAKIIKTCEDILKWDECFEE